MRSGFFSNVLAGVIGAAVFSVLVYIWGLGSSGGLITLLNGATKSEFNEVRKTLGELQDSVENTKVRVQEIEALANTVRKLESGIAKMDGNGLELRAPFAISEEFVPSGFMGDAEHGNAELDHVRSCGRQSDQDDACIRIRYRPSSNGWAAIRWQFPESNWGNGPGRAVMNAKRIEFFARGESGQERVVFEAGGTTGLRFEDSFEVRTGPIALTREWESYTIDLTEQDLSSVISAFTWIAEAHGNPDQVTIYLDDIRYVN